jgi:parallel beta-helix repeat protein
MQKIIPILLALALLAASFTVFALPVRGFSKMIVVPVDYPTITSALGNATDGDIVFVKKGIYEEQTLQINKTISLLGEDAQETVIKLSPPYNITWVLTQSYFEFSDAITVDANDFKIHNLSIILTPGGFISIIGDRTQISENNLTTGGPETGLRVIGSYCNIADNVLSGIDHFDHANNTYVSDTKSGGFISINGSSNVILQNALSKVLVFGDFNHIDSNTITGIQLSNSNGNIVSENNISSPTAYYGVRIAGGSSNNVLYGNNIQALSYNVEIDSAIAINNTFYHNNFILKNNNKHALINASSSNFWDNNKEGNYWPDYNGVDANGDGIGDTPYIIDDNNSDHYPLISQWSGALPKEEFPLPQTLIVTFAVISLILALVLIIYLKRRTDGIH